MDCTSCGYFSNKQITFPDEERIKEKPVAILECCQEIPCNPCEYDCPSGAISVPGNINAVPVMDFEKCTGCGICLGGCPGLSIFLIHIKEGVGLVTIPYELDPPAKGEAVILLNRAGQAVADGKVNRILKLKQHDRTILVTLEMAPELVKDIRGFRRKNG